VITHRKPGTIRPRGRHVGVVGVAAAALALTAAGCSNGSGGSSGAAPAAPTPTASSATVSAQPTSLGMIIVNNQGRTVYVFANDKSSASTCTGACAANWPFVPAPASLPASLPGVTGKLGTTTRAGGARQLTVAGHPVYTFAGDSAAGQTNGQGVVLDGGLWTVVSPTGAPDPHPAGATTQATSGPSY
jgi:predicted lipoprotein with Yx(FWY)xxD motif